MNSLWKFETGIYAYQTDEKTIAKKMKKSHNFTLLNEGLNCNHWVFLTQKNCLRDALNTFVRLMGEEAIFNVTTDAWES